MNTYFFLNHQLKIFFLNVYLLNKPFLYIRWQSSPPKSIHLVNYPFKLLLDSCKTVKDCQILIKLGEDNSTIRNYVSKDTNLCQFCFVEPLVNGLCVQKGLQCHLEF
jgi:hypothetical protein